LAEAQSDSRPYHHGHLREALVSEAVELIKEQGVEKLTIRALAERVGVSHAAPQYHFADKASLLIAVAADGFRRLFAAMQRALAEEDPARRLHDLGRAYVDFALQNPAHYRLMFATELLHQKSHSEEFVEIGTQALSTLRTVVAEITGEQDQEVPEKLSGAAFFCWAAVHGAVMLHLDGTFPFESGCGPNEEVPPDILEKHEEFGLTITDEKIEQILDLVVRGVLALPR
jgi:AcrR family transcriptional regulator